MLDFDPQNYGPAVADLLAQEPVCELGPGRPVSAVSNSLDDLSFEGVFNGNAVADKDMANCCISGLWLLFDYLDDSHTISQDIYTQTGSYWHGIMHRREPDFSNAKYWFRKVGDHPIFDDLAECAGQIAESHGLSQQISVGKWDPFEFVDLCQNGLRERGKLEDMCRAIAQAEWRLLFHFCYERAIG